MNKINFFFFFFFFVSCTNQKLVKVPENFSKKVIPENFSSDWYKLNNSSDDYSVQNKNGKLEIKNIEPQNGSKLKVKNGILVGNNGGEWGGELLYQSDNSKLKPEKIKEGNIVKIFEFQNKIYFVEGLAHMNYSGGALYELNTIQSQFKFEKLLDFEDAPEAIETSKDKIYVASHQNFYVIENLSKKMIFENEFWTSLYPNSIAVFNDENIFIGMRSGIAKLNLKDKKIEFYRENNK